jgi:Transposase DDE domain
MSKGESSEMSQEIQKVLGEYAQRANEWSHFSQRAGIITAAGFVQILVLGWLKEGKASLNQLAHTAQALGYHISGAGIHERMNSEGVMLLASVLKLALEQWQSKHPLPLKPLQRFEGVYITDSTQIALPSSLASVFQGNQANGMLKLQVQWDYLNGNLRAIETQAGKTPDQSCHLHVDQVPTNSLQLFDLGYFKQEYLQQIAAQQAFFVCRAQSQLGWYAPESGQTFDLQHHLKRFKGSATEFALLLGERVKLPLRLLVRRLSKPLAQARRREAKAKARKQGKGCSQQYLFFLGWDMLVSNLEAGHWSLAQIFDLYPIRTQIEWLFRTWKDQMAVDEIGQWRVERVLCQLYAHLIGALLCQRLTATWRWREQEYSFFKCVQLIQSNLSDLLHCLAHAGWGCAAWVERLEAAFRQFGRKSKRRKAPSTAQILYNWGLS